MLMFYHDKRLQYYTPPERPDAIYAKKIQELIGGTFGEFWYAEEVSQW